MKALNDRDKDFIIDSLNTSFHQAHDMLKRDYLGDIQIKNLKEIKKRSKEIMRKLGVFD